MNVSTKTVTGRRELHYDSLDGLLEDVQRLAAGDVETLGNWSFGQIMDHLAIAFNGSIDGLDLHIPWYIKIFARTFLKNRFLETSVPPGFEIAAKDREKLVPPGNTTTEQGLKDLEKAIARLKQEPQRVAHPVLGSLSHEDWTRFHLRHAEMHLSFVRPV